MTLLSEFRDSRKGIIVVDHSSATTGSVIVVVGAEDKSAANGTPAIGQTAPH
jgi:hypothetical protein